MNRTEQVAALLRERGADDVEHPGGTPAAHLERVQRRPLLAQIIGERAERLVHRYGACDRRRTWPELATTRQVHDRHTGTAEVLADDELRDFADLSLVNELDVAEHAPGFLAEHGSYFRQLTGRWSPVLSPAVLADARRVLAT